MRNYFLPGEYHFLFKDYDNLKLFVIHLNVFGSGVVSDGNFHYTITVNIELVFLCIHLATHSPIYNTHVPQLIKRRYQLGTITARRFTVHILQFYVMIWQINSTKYLWTLCIICIQFKQNLHIPSFSNWF